MGVCGVGNCAISDMPSVGRAEQRNVEHITAIATVRGHRRSFAPPPRLGSGFFAGEAAWDMRLIIRTREIWAAFTAPEWASQQKLDWSPWERVFDLLKKKVAEVARRSWARGVGDR